ncbi:Poly(A)-specific ribonuclease PARN, partial [Orchesella cincta]
LYLAEENSTPLPVPENLRKFMEETQQQVKTLVAGGLKELLLEDLNPFQRKLIFNNIKPKFNDLYFETVLREDDMDSSSVSESDTESSPAGATKTTPRAASASTGRPSRSRILRVAKMTEDERKAREDEKKKQHMLNINKGVGFSKVIRKISESGKICVGHNMILDIAHSIHQFVDDLPEDLATFKALVQTAFPNLVDTKLMCCTHPFRELFSSSVLGDVLKRVQDDPFSLPIIKKESRESSLSYELADLKSHEAGYDAFITGVCFIGLCQYLGTLQIPKKKVVLPNSPLVMPFLNKLYLMRMLDITYMNISGTDLTPRRDHVFHVNCPKESTTKTILNMFSPFGQVQVWWQDDHNLFVSLNDKDQAALVMNNIETEGSIKVVPFCQYQTSVKEKKRPLHRDSPDRAAFKVTETNQDASTPISISNSSGRQHSSSEGSSSPPLESVQKKKRPKTESRSFKKSAKPGKGSGGNGKKEASHFDEPSNWD